MSELLDKVGKEEAALPFKKNDRSSIEAHFKVYEKFIAEARRILTPETRSAIASTSESIEPKLSEIYVELSSLRRTPTFDDVKAVVQKSASLTPEEKIYLITAERQNRFLKHMENYAVLLNSIDAADEILEFRLALLRK